MRKRILVLLLGMFALADSTNPAYAKRDPPQIPCNCIHGRIESVAQTPCVPSPSTQYTINRDDKHAGEITSAQNLETYWFDQWVQKDAVLAEAMSEIERLKAENAEFRGINEMLVEAVACSH